MTDLTNPQPDETVNELARILVTGFYGGLDRTADDPGILRSIADWFDRIDDQTDALIAKKGSDFRVHRDVQIDLRRIAGRLGDAIALGDA